MQVQVARIGKPHGIKGEVTVLVLTDAPDSRFAVGAEFVVEPARIGTLTVKSSRWNKDILLLGFEGTTTRTQAVQDLLIVEDTEGDEVLVPFVDEIVPEVNIEEGYVLLTPPAGLFTVNKDAAESDDSGEAADTGDSGADNAEDTEGTEGAGQ